MDYDYFTYDQIIENSSPASITDQIISQEASLLSVLPMNKLGNLFFCFFSGFSDDSFLFLLLSTNNFRLFISVIMGLLRSPFSHALSSGCGAQSNSKLKTYVTIS